MNIIVVRDTKGSFGNFSLSKRTLWAVALSLCVGLPTLFLVCGFWLGAKHGAAGPGTLYESLRTDLQSQRVKVEEAARSAKDNMNALTVKMAQLQAQAIRLDALGDRLTKMANLDGGEFDFTQRPALGGPENPDTAQVLASPDFVATLDALSKQLENRGQQLSVLETLIMNRNLQAEVFPAGRPVKAGWISSYFGVRTDPFHGGSEHHGGIDFAGKEGSQILSVASGVVTFSGERSGYGNMVEINHGNGYATRYGHNSENLVHVGDTIKKGQPVALMGSTGRSTGPHVHFEVVHNGQIVNPREYVEAKPADMFGPET